jgi:hypothetical protein
VRIRSQRSSILATAFGLTAWAAGTPKFILELLAQIGLSVSYSTLRSAQESLRKQSLATIRTLSGPFLLSADNLQRKTSDHVEQRTYGPAKFHKYTALIVHRLRDTNDSDCSMNLLDSHRQTSPQASEDPEDGELTLLRNIYPDRLTKQNVFRHLAITIGRSLVRFTPELQHLLGCAELQHPIHRPPPVGHRTESFPLETVDFDPSSTEGTISVLEDVCLRQLARNREDLAKHAILCVNDQGVAKNIRGAQKIRSTDRGGTFDRLLPFQQGVGMFHVALNLGWLILATHRGDADNPGSLAYWIELLDKKRHNSAKPEYYTLVATYRQILDGMILYCWRDKLDLHSLHSQGLTTFALPEDSPVQLTPEQVTNLSNSILFSFATPDYKDSVYKKAKGSRKRTQDTGDEPTSTASTSAPSATDSDEIYGGMKRLMRDLLIFFEFDLAVHSGDFGRVEQLFGSLTLMFCGGGATNYTYEFLHLIQNLHKGWPDEYA